MTAENTNLVANTRISQTVNNWLPYLTYRYKFSDNHSLHFRYNTDSRQPDLNQLQPVPDNSNPNNVSLGNPDLLPTFSHGLNLNYNKYKPISGKSAWGGLTFNAVQNDFANSILYDSIGRTITQPLNVDGNYNGNGYMNMRFPLFAKLIEINPGVNFNFSNRSNYINNQKNKTLNAGGNAELEIGIEKEKIEFRVGANYGYNYTKSKLSEESNKPYSDYSFHSSLEWGMPKKFKFKTDAEYTINRQRTAGYNINYIIWNASIGKTFLKKDNLIFSVDAYDILNQNINTYRDVNDNVVSDVRTTIIGRYILFRVTFKFNSNKEKEEEND